MRKEYLSQNNRIVYLPGAAILFHNMSDNGINRDIEKLYSYSALYICLFITLSVVKTDLINAHIRLFHGCFIAVLKTNRVREHIDEITAKLGISLL